MMLQKKKKYIVMVFVGILISLSIDSVIPFQKQGHNKIYDFIFSILLTIVIWEGNLFIDRKLNIKFPWVQKPMRRLFLQFPIGTLFSAVSIYIGMSIYNTYFCEIPENFKNTLFSSSIIIGTLFSIVLIGIEISIQFFNQWKNSLVEIEKYKTESVKAQLQNLKNQINPHFLFNNLSVLSSLVYKDQDKAVDFINQLSKVYRYLLDNVNTELVTLEHELTFIKSYTYLLQIRFQANIIFKLDIDPIYLHNLIPPMALQMLLENAIKHNEISHQQPLTILVTVSNNQLVTSNNLQLRTNHEPSSKTGLQNIKDRYKHFSDREVEIIESETFYTVKLPLLHH
jgi:sensor histidine kinase YesM